jgi:hypothetical protein
LNAEQLAAVAVGLKVAALIPERRVRILACTEFSWEAERGKCAAWLVTVEAKGGTVIFDPYASECGRFRIDPFTEYGISPDAARLMSQHNQVQL